MLTVLPDFTFICASNTSLAILISNVLLADEGAVPSSLLPCSWGRIPPRALPCLCAGHLHTGIVSRLNILWTDNPFHAFHCSIIRGY